MIFFSLHSTLTYCEIIQVSCDTSKDQGEIVWEHLIDDNFCANFLGHVFMIQTKSTK